MRGVTSGSRESSKKNIEVLQVPSSVYVPTSLTNNYLSILTFTYHLPLLATGKGTSSLSLIPNLPVLLRVIHYI